ncbi:MAG TPA: hypothetical protein VJK02_04590 [Anaerolineales bacterium]|nr:hypothetical protein [Anaerolineales bacterium]
MAYLTIFTAPKPFAEPHIGRIQRNAIRSWLALGPEVQVILIGDETGMQETARELGVAHLQDVERNEHGTPLVSSIFALARAYDQSPNLAYVNTDILLFGDLLEGTMTAASSGMPFLIIGQRWDLDLEESLDLSSGWQDRMRKHVLEAGRLHPPGGSDYFVFPRGCYDEVPSFAIGRAGWDNWMIFYARRRGWPVVDATSSILVVHQSHDYGHLPGGRPHYRLPESFRNVELAGGRRRVFSLQDATHQLVDGRLQPRRLGWVDMVRRLETFPSVVLGSTAMAQVTFSLLHPVGAIQEFSGWLRKKVSPILKR